MKRKEGSYSYAKKSNSNCNFVTSNELLHNPDTILSINAYINSSNSLLIISCQQKMTN